MEDKKTLIGAADLSFSYLKGQAIIKQVSISVCKGTITALIGANGCGKSTLFRLLAGSLKPSSGTICLEGVPIEKIHRRDYAKRVAVVHQNNTAPDDLTVRKLVSLGRTPYKSIFAYGQNSEDAAAVERALYLTDTEQLAGRMISQLSGGQKQRVWLAMALAQSADILLLDEITTYLDIRYQLEILHLIKKLNQDMHSTVLMVMHDINQVLEFCDEAVIMRHGEILNAGSTAETITEDSLNKAFCVDTQIAFIGTKKICVFKAGERRSNENI